MDPTAEHVCQKVIFVQLLMKCLVDGLRFATRVDLPSETELCSCCIVMSCNVVLMMPSSTRCAFLHSEFQYHLGLRPHRIQTRYTQHFFFLLHQCMPCNATSNSEHWAAAAAAPHTEVLHHAMWTCGTLHSLDAIGNGTSRGSSTLWTNHVSASPVLWHIGWTASPMWPT